MKLLERWRNGRARRRAAAAEKAVQQAEGRREVEADDKSLVQAVHVPPPPGPFSGPF